MKRFMNLSIGVLCLSLSALVGIHGGLGEAEATIVAGTGVIAQHTEWMLDSSGAVWQVKYQNDVLTWLRRSDFDPPVPVDQIKFWQFNLVVTHDNVCWLLYNGVWDDAAWPGDSPVPAQDTSWGEMKSKHKAGKNQGK